MAQSSILTVDKPPAQQTLDAFRRWGYLQADLDPLGRLPPAPHPDLDHLSGEAAAAGRRFYCGTIGVEFMHIPDAARRRWIAERMEGETPPVDPAMVFDRLVRAETFEQTLQARYLGTKRFSIEGVAALIPLLEEMIDCAADDDAEQVVLGMPHRGRLSVMAHLVGVPIADLFAGFEDVDPRSILGGGDVKYHMGATGAFRADDGREIRIHLASNPSHLEAVDPVAVGRVRAKQQRLGPGGERKVVPILLHGDAAFAGQGILAETLNLSRLEGYSVGGTLHVVVNNLIGFTTEPAHLHSSRFATDVAKRLPIPIFHVNGEDLEAVVRVARLAVDYRTEFGDDVVVDLVGYRRHGHSEVDDPTVTQPLLYREIEQHPPLWRIYAEDAGFTEEECEAKIAEIKKVLDAEYEKAGKMEKKPTLARLPDYWGPFQGGRWDPAQEVETGVAAERLGKIAKLLTTVPEGFHVHPKVGKLLEQRAEMGRGERSLDYGMAEALAFGSLLADGVPVRLSGQDSRRATFNQRHAVLIDVENEKEFFPLAQLADEKVFFEVYDSMLSEAAVLGFEYGFSRDYPEALTVWEAQFGDFVNGAQIIIDQFVTAGEDKWGLLSGLVMLLPHGYEGQGPEHSSARFERFLTLAAEHNIQVCQPSTAAQYFHLLRRQALRRWRKPLVVMTPKSMLRHRASGSELAELTGSPPHTPDPSVDPKGGLKGGEGRPHPPALRRGFLPVVGDESIAEGEATRVLLSTGKIGHELVAEREKRKDKTTAIVFLDQLYPFPEKELAAALGRHPAARTVVWVQEEPANMGAFNFVLPRIERVVGGQRQVRSVKRSASASPATGSAKAHAIEQAGLIRLAFTTFEQGR